MGKDIENGFIAVKLGDGTYQKLVPLTKSPYENMDDVLYTVRCVKKQDVESKLGYEISESDMTCMRLRLALDLIETKQSEKNTKNI